MSASSGLSNASLNFSVAAIKACLSSSLIGPSFGRCSVAALMLFVSSARDIFRSTKQDVGLSFDPLLRRNPRILWVSNVEMSKKGGAR